MALHSNPQKTPEWLQIVAVLSAPPDATVAARSAEVAGRFARVYWIPGMVMVMPASTVSTWPVTQRASSLAR